MNEKQDNMTAEEGIITLRQMVAALTGVDPRFGQETKPLPKLTKEEIAKLFGGQDGEDEKRK